ncbi:MAG: dicarboxylate/amino acid:cation symporter [Akkermansiaceae bacterium]|jgi:Na+/H+-dicarboxylate symporter|nr:dicarboxylate/amino acid:cation symporter [Akkermansiaceae bacterium]
MPALISKPLLRWQSMPLYFRTLIGMAIGAILGTTMGPDAAMLAKPGSILMGLVQMLAAPVAFFAIVHALAGAKIEPGKTGTLVRLLATNTLVAIMIGLLVANFVRPGERRSLSESDKAKVEAQAASIADQIATAETSAKQSGLGDKVLQILEKLPRSVMGPFTDGGSVIGVIVLALMLGLALRKVSPDPDATVKVVKVFMDAFIAMLHWVVQLVPIIVLGVVAGEVGINGFSSFYSLLWLIAAVLLALALQFMYYMARVSLQSWVSPARLLHGCRDALAMAFSTASSTATMPLTYKCLTERVKVRKSSANLGALVGANFNNDGTALYEAMAALFVAQLLGRDLDFAQQAVVVLCAVAASVGAAGIPSAGLITMTLVFTAVGLPLEYSLLLVPIDWFLDRFRTMINVSGDLCVSCVLDGREKPEESSCHESHPAL